MGINLLKIIFFSTHLYPGRNIKSYLNKKKNNLLHSRSDFIFFDEFIKNRLLIYENHRFVPEKNLSKHNSN